MKKNLTLLFLLGLMYMNIEVLWGAITAMKWPLIGSTSLWMMLVGGILGLIIGKMNEPESLLRKLRYKLKVILGAVTIVTVELISGLILNKLLGFDIWDYSQNAYNFMGQIDLLHSVCWLILTPFVFWLDDALRFYFFYEHKPKNLACYYAKAFWPQC